MPHRPGRGHAESRAKCARKHEYALRRSLWPFTDESTAVRFQYDWHEDTAVVALLRQTELGV